MFATVRSPANAATVAFSGIGPLFWTSMVNVTVPPIVTVFGLVDTSPIARSGLAFTSTVIVTLWDTGPFFAIMVRL